MSSPFRSLSDPERRTVTIWTDGVCRPNPGAGGWAAVLINEAGGRKEIYGAERCTTNNRMDLTAACAALELVRKPSRILVTLDCDYVSRSARERLSVWKANGWLTEKRKPVENQALWVRLSAAAEPHEVMWKWISCHAHDDMSMRVGALASEAHRSLISAGA